MTTTKQIPAAAHTENAAFSRKVRRMLGLDLHGWEQLMLLSLLGAGALAIAVFITTASVVVLQRHETAEAKRELDEYKLSADGRVADAKREGIEAGKVAGNAMVRASELEKEAATIKKEAATANASAAQANERAAQIQRAAAWRIIDPVVKSRAAAALAATIGGSVEISWSANDPESLFVAYQTEDIFKEANARAGKRLWTVTLQPRVFSRQIFFNTRIFGQDNALVGMLTEAFRKNGIPTIADAVPTVINDSPGVQIGGGPPPPATIFVGAKPPPNWTP
jgi:hypothetical protein